MTGHYSLAKLTCSINHLTMSPGFSNISTRMLRRPLPGWPQSLLGLIGRGPTSPIPSTSRDEWEGSGQAWWAASSSVCLCSVLQQPGVVPELRIQWPQPPAAVQPQRHRDLHLHADGLFFPVTMATTSQGPAPEACPVTWGVTRASELANICYYGAAALP